MKSAPIVLCLAVSALALSTPLLAQTQRQGGGANAAVMQQLQALTTERSALQAENTRLKAEADGLRKERDALKAGQDGAARRSKAADDQATTAQRERERLEGELAQQKTRMQELVDKFRETATTLRDIETEGTAAKQTLAQRDIDLKACVDRNHKLYELNDEVLLKLADQGFWSSFSRHEPFTRLKRTQLENLADGYRDRADEQRQPSGAAAR